MPTPTPPGNDARERSMDMLKNGLIALLFLIAGWNYNAQQKNEERIFTLASSTMTEAKGQQMEDRISRSIETRFNDLSNRLELILKLVQSQQNK